jgi:hypothetical protein
VGRAGVADAIELGGVDVGDERFAGGGAGVLAGGEGQPVVGVDDVMRLFARDVGGQGGEAVDFGEQVGAVDGARAIGVWRVERRRGR